MTNQFSSVQLLSCVQLFVTPWNVARQASLSITNSRSFLKLMPIESAMTSSHFILCHPLLLLSLIPPNIRVFSNESTLQMRWPKYWSFGFSISPSNEYPGLISFRMHWLDLLAVQGTLKSLLQHHTAIKKWRYYFANKGLYSQSCGFSSSHAWMWELDHKEGWTVENLCFRTVVLEKTLESPLNWKEIKLVNPKGNQSWIFIGRTDAEVEAPVLWPPDAKRWIIRKDPDAGKDWRWEEKGMTEDEMVGWHHRLNGHDFEQAPGVGDGQGVSGMLGHKELDMTEWLICNNSCTSFCLSCVFIYWRLSLHSYPETYLKYVMEVTVF